MIRKLTLFLLIAVGALMSAQAQYDTLTIQEIQMVAPANLANCDDVSPFLDDTVVVFATVVVDAMVEDPLNPAGPEDAGPEESQESRPAPSTPDGYHCHEELQ